MENTDEIIELPYGSFLSRSIAFVIDYLLLIFIMGFILAIVKPAGFALEGPEVTEINEQYIRDLSEAAGPWFYGFLLVWSLYDALMHSSKWQATLGKRVMGIIVTDIDGERIGFGKGLIRALIKLLSLAIFFPILFIAAFTSRRQAVHDMLAETVVLQYRIP